MLISEVEVQNKQQLFYREHCDIFSLLKMLYITYPKKDLGGSDFWTLGLG